VITALVVFLVFSILILVHEGGHFVAARRAGMRVEAFSLGMGKRLFGIKIGDTDYRISLVPFGGYCKMAGEEADEAKGAPDEFGSKPVGSRFWVVASGPLTNYVFAFILFWIIFMMGVPTLSNKVGQLLDGYPAQKAGIVPGDRITAINGKDVRYWEDILAVIKSDYAKSKALDLTVRRNDKDMRISVAPDISEVTNVFGQKISRPMLGIGPESEIMAVRYDPVKAAYFGGKRLLEITAMTYKMIWLLITGGMPVKDSLSGPIGIIYFINQAANMGIVPLLIITAHVSLALAIFNLLPIPPLDGGHILFLALEKIKGKPVSPKVQESVAQVAFALLMVFLVFVSIQDLKKFTPLGKNRIFNKDKAVDRSLK
jgi:regulator of sigma E protease